MSISRPAVAALPKVAPLPAVRKWDVGPYEQLEKGSPLVDEYGLDAGIYGDFPKYQRRLIRMMIRDLGGSLRERPPARASIAEAIFYGLLLDNGFNYRAGVITGARNFIFQSYELGGRQPGGSVVDFMVYHNFSSIAVRVQSVFHDLRDPFSGGGQVVETEKRLREQLEAAFYIDYLVDVNRPPERVLETSNEPARVQRELQRVLYGER